MAMTQPCKPRALAVIPGRAGSKGLPGKNAMLVAGRPMIEYSIDAAKRAKCVDRIVVTTDGDDIAAVAEAAGVEVVRRPEALASDTATVDSAVRHAIAAVDAPHDNIIILYANVPVRPDDLIDRAFDMLLVSEADSVQSYVDVAKCHPYWMMRIDEESRVHAHQPNNIYRRQDLPPLYLPDGGVIAVRRESLMQVDPEKPHAFLGRERRAVITNPGEVIDVDSAIDAVVAEAILSRALGGLLPEAALR